MLRAAIPFARDRTANTGPRAPEGSDTEGCPRGDLLKSEAQGPLTRQDWEAKPVSEGAVRVPQGRLVWWSAWGDPKGSVVVMQPHMNDTGRRALSAVRRGEVPYSDWLDRVETLDAELQRLQSDDSYPAGPDREDIEAWTIDLHLRAWEAGADRATA